ncbi:MAG TPA: DoxX family protein [Ohtaekwangia sp.]|nr:DoxX family protein [Ohtaekwangia sp.]
METTQISKSRLWASWTMSGLVILFMLVDAVFKLLPPNEMMKASVHELGYAEHHLPIMGILALIATILYIVPSTSVLGAVLLTGYFGGAIATHVRIDNPLFSHVLFPVYLGILMWGGLWLRDHRVGKVLLSTGR